ncbi:uncharacterized protein GIQ15_06016 [Arthroderma uncinatum]|uniref:uncharacterized protein n=1 Tax=Arthroderma uncinatum TaxID=74035 RepID=UPI00144A8B26|nr:uncharacterized protein GIQ15_06016 [Arthroderma uncinatum]KAF3480669.1 hypothetical protein GIQ15_06016 [Arthroderma uncinatum]
MSTFNGVVEVDSFRKNPGRPAPLACFLSHVHSDHLMGLESLRAPFVYCSAATREILLRIEKYPHRMNFSKGILESRKQHYKHLAKLLRPIPLQVPTEIELMPGNTIRVTLFDANHCPGSVMFLIEGGGKAILYTGDIRAEMWWVQSLVRNPVLIPYTMGDSRLNNIYLDTTFATKSDIHQDFPSKADGIRELLSKVKEYPKDTLFYLRSWTFGYEDVWLALSTALNTKIHVDQYQLGLYKSLTARSGNGFGVDDSLYLCGFPLGNSSASGCLTHDQSVRVHSCEPGVMCSKISAGKSVYITPIITRTKEGYEIPEVGAGGGKGDLEQSHELELPDDATFQLLLDLCKEQIKEPETRDMAISALTKAYESGGKAIPLDDYGLKEEEEIPLARLAGIIGQGLQQKAKEPLPNTIRFPYSRHSCYSELCQLVAAFKPEDVYPCTVDSNSWNERVSMQALFGHLCSGTTFSHDKMMRRELQGEGYRPLKRQRRASDTPSEALSTQRSNLDVHNEPEGQESPFIDSHANQPEERQCSPPDGEQQGEDDSIDDYPTSFPTQLTGQSSESPTTRFKAIKQAMQQNFSNDEISFYLPSFTDSQPDAEPTSHQQVQVAEVEHVSIHSQPAASQEELQQEQEELDLQLSLSVSHTFTTNEGNGNEEDEEEDDDDDDDDVESIISLSTSAFLSQPTVKPAGQVNHETADMVLVPSSAPGPETDLELEPCSSSARSYVRKQMRITAYRAARKGTYEAWADTCPLISVRDNHTHPEIEL